MALRQWLQYHLFRGAAHQANDGQDGELSSVSRCEARELTWQQLSQEHTWYEGYRLSFEDRPHIPERHDPTGLPCKQTFYVVSWPPSPLSSSTVANSFSLPLLPLNRTTSCVSLSQIPQLSAPTDAPLHPLYRKSSPLTQPSSPMSKATLGTSTSPQKSASVLPFSGMVVGTVDRDATVPRKQPMLARFRRKCEVWITRASPLKGKKRNGGRIKGFRLLWRQRSWGYPSHSRRYALYCYFSSSGRFRPLEK